MVSSISNLYEQRDALVSEWESANAEEAPGEEDAEEEVEEHDEVLEL